MGLFNLISGIFNRELEQECTEEVEHDTVLVRSYLGEMIEVTSDDTEV